MYSGGRWLYRAAMRDPRSISMWMDTVDGDLSPRPPLGGDIDVDVAIVGAGYTGLWTAYYLKRADPSLRIAILEKEFAGFGASGRNGGWLSLIHISEPTRRTPISYAVFCLK